MLLELKKISVPPGQRILLSDISWQELEDILQDLGDNRNSKIAYNQGLLEIMVPLPEHERNKEQISDLLKALLEELDIEFCTLGSTTFKNRLMLQGMEPDNCFYIQNEARIRNKDKLDLSIDTPPDLAIEVDVTSRTNPQIYRNLAVPELWRFERDNLQINVLIDGEYVSTEFSPLFPNLPVKKLIPEYLHKCRIEGRNKSIKQFRSLIQQMINKD
ncbi:MAG TPA: Uma2 family endonuclease [Allocoleopsis sp.]